MQPEREEGTSDQWVPPGGADMGCFMIGLVGIEVAGVVPGLAPSAMHAVPPRYRRSPDAILVSTGGRGASAVREAARLSARFSAWSILVPAGESETNVRALRTMVQAARRSGGHIGVLAADHPMQQGRCRTDGTATFLDLSFGAAPPETEPRITDIGGVTYVASVSATPPTWPHHLWLRPATPSPDVVRLPGALPDFFLIGDKEVSR